MKKFILILVLGLIAFVSQAQTANGVVSLVGATLTNTETDYLTITSPKVITANYTVNIAIVSTNTSGTATVTAMPQGSLDGTTYFDLQASPDVIDNAGTPANKFYNYADSYWRYYRIALSSTGTGVSSYTAKLGIKIK